MHLVCHPNAERRRKYGKLVTSNADSTRCRNLVESATALKGKITAHFSCLGTSLSFLQAFRNSLAKPGSSWSSRANSGGECSCYQTADIANSFSCARTFCPSHLRTHVATHTHTHLHTQAEKRATENPSKRADHPLKKFFGHRPLCFSERK